MKTTGNTILVTGAGTGIGLEATKLFSQRGNRVIMVARNGERLRSEADQLENVSTFVCDISDEDQLEGLVRYLETQHPGFNVIFLNAAVTHNYSLYGEENAFEHAREEMITNYLSAVYLTQKLEPALAEKPEAAIVITTSGVAFVPDIQNPTYSATKAALHSFVQASRLVLKNKGSGIKVFELMAPLTESPFSKDVMSDQKMPAREVAEALLAGLEQDELELRVGMTENLYQTYLKSPGEALTAVNAVTGG
jgi:uncharacterized oxidoreductase